MLDRQEGCREPKRKEARASYDRLLSDNSLGTAG